MDAESFFDRWEKRNAERRAAEVPVAAAPEPQAPSLEDVAMLTPDSDFRRFVAAGVDENVRRSAMKKLFADPRFNVMDGLDVYIEDYHSFQPIPAAMLAALTHARSLLDPLAQLMPAPEKEAAEDAPVQDEPPAEEPPRHDDPVQDM